MSVPKIQQVTFQFPLHYAASWNFAEYAPYPHMGLVLAFDDKTDEFLICKYIRELKRWQLLGGFKLRDTHAHLCDNTTRIRVLGWQKPFARQGVKMYLDLQFAEEEGLHRVLREMCGKVMIQANRLETSQQMIDIFRKVPEMLIDSGAPKDGYGSAVMMAHPPSSRYYRPELARLDDASVSYVPAKVETGDHFDAWTRKHMRPGNAVQTAPPINAPSTAVHKSAPLEAESTQTRSPPASLKHQQPGNTTPAATPLDALSSAVHKSVTPETEAESTQTQTQTPTPTLKRQRPDNEPAEEPQRSPVKRPKLDIQARKPSNPSKVAPMLPTATQAPADPEPSSSNHFAASETATKYESDRSGGRVSGASASPTPQVGKKRSLEDPDGVGTTPTKKPKMLHPATAPQPSLDPATKSPAPQQPKFSVPEVLEMVDARMRAYMGGGLKEASKIPEFRKLLVQRKKLVEFMAAQQQQLKAANPKAAPTGIGVGSQNA